MRSSKQPVIHAAALLGTLLATLGTSPVLRAANPASADAAAVGALTLEPKRSPLSVGWTGRADAIAAAQHPDTLADFLADRTGFEKIDREANDYLATPAPSVLTAPAATTTVSAPTAAADTAPALAPDALPADFSYGVASSAPASLYRPTADANLVSAAAPTRSGGYVPAASNSASPAAANPPASVERVTTPNALLSSGGWTEIASSTRSRVAATTPFPATTAQPARSGAGSGMFTDLAGTAPVQVHPAPFLADPQTSALPAGQTLYISELNGIISSATGSGGTVSTFKTISTTNALFGIGAFGGSLFVVEQNANVIDRVIISTGAVSTFASLGATNNRPTALAIDTTGNVYVTLSNTGGINKITPAGVVSLFATLPAGSQPQGLGFAPNGNLYSANSGLDSISQITPAGVVTTLATFTGAAYPAGLYFGGLTVDKNGVIYVVDQETTSGALGNVYKVTAAGAISFFASVGANTQPIGLAFDANGVLYTANAASISQITTAGVVSTFATDGNGPDYLVITVPEPATYLGGTLLLGVLGMGLRRRLRLVAA